MKRSGIWVVLTLAMLAGCAKQEASQSASAQVNPVSAQTNAAPAKPSEPGAKAEPPKQETSAKDLKAPNAKANSGAISEQSEFAQWFGLSNHKPMDFTLTRSDTNATSTGSMTLSRSGEGKYQLDRTGGLVQLGASDKLELRQDGVYTVESSAGKLSGPHLELPADVSPGKTWTTDIQLTTEAGQAMQDREQNSIVGQVKLSLNGNNYQALLLESNGSAKIGEQTLKTRTKTWLVKGKGMVKTVIETESAGGQKTTLTLQEAGKK